MVIAFELSKETRELLEKMREKNRTRTDRVRQMFVEVLPHQERNDKPTVPSEEAIRLQTRIDCEEFFEKLSALYSDAMGLAYAKDIVDMIAERGEIRKDLHDRLPEFANALADNAVTNEGFAALFGIDLEPVFREVHASNLRKKDGPIDATGKKRKSDGWVGPDVAGMLRNQGWQPSSESKVDEPIPYRARPVLVSEYECPIHGIRRFGEDDLRMTSCSRCENAQYNGSEIDQIGEQNGNETAALAYLAKESAKVDPGPQKEPTRYAVPIDRTLWTSDETVELPNVSVKIENFPVVSCKANFLHSKRFRRLVIELPAAHKQFGRYEMLRRNEAICKLSIRGSYLGTVRVESVALGSQRDDRNMQITFVKVDVSGDD